MISAAQSVAGATSHLVETADALLRTKSRTPEHLIVASTGVTASTAQLMAAARVKANPMWPCSEALEGAARSVSEANKALVTLVTGKSAQFSQLDCDLAEGSSESLPTTLQGFKIERKLQSARIQLARLRQSQYALPNDNGNQTNSSSILGGISVVETQSDDEDNSLPSSDDWLMTIPPKLEELKL